MVLSLSAAEFEFWLDFRRLHGFPADRLEAVAANAGVYVGAVWGGKLGADALTFKPREVFTREQVRSGFDALTPDRFPERTNG